MDIKIKPFLIFVLIITFLFEAALSKYISFISYLDEILAIFCILAFILKFATSYIKKNDVIFVAFLMIFILTGLFGNYLSGIERPTRAIILDIFSNLKFFAVILFGGIYQLKEDELEILKEIISKFIRFVFLLMLFLSILSQFVNIGMTGDIRYGIKSFTFVYENASGLNTHYYYMMCLFSATLYKKEKLRNYSDFFVVVAIIPWILTMRTRAIAFAAIYVALYYFYIKKSKKFKMKFYHILLAGVLLFLLGYKTFYDYFIAESNQVRHHMLITSIKIFRDYMPFGTGFASFGTEMSRQYYSPVYFHYEISHIWGLSPTEPYFILDQFWCAIFGQFGLIGTAIVIYLIAYSYIKLFKNVDNAGMKVAIITLIYTSLISSISAASFIQGSTIGCCFTLFLLKKSQLREDRYGWTHNLWSNSYLQ